MLHSMTGISSPLGPFSILTDDDMVERSSSNFRPCFRYFPPAVPLDYMVLQRCLPPHGIEIFLGWRWQLRGGFLLGQTSRSLLRDKMEL